MCCSSPPYNPKNIHIYIYIFDQHFLKGKIILEEFQIDLLNIFSQVFQNIPNKNFFELRENNAMTWDHDMQCGRHRPSDKTPELSTTTPWTQMVLPISFLQV